MNGFTYNMIRLYARLDEQIRGERDRARPDVFRLLRLQALRLNLRNRLNARLQPA